MSRPTGQSQSKTIMALALACLLLCAQFFVAHHSVAHVFEKSPAQEKHENGCNLCMAAHALSAGVDVFAALPFIPPRQHFEDDAQRIFLNPAAIKAFHATGPPARR